uniref:GNAT family N-acetyltransferase n=1 Tax=uncultured Rhizobium sp. TaxID=155567 RepID=UPI00263979EC|nr:GNAT family protein [uncultured Rhizobium sp.]
MIDTTHLILRPHATDDLEAYVPLWQETLGHDAAPSRLPVLSEEEVWARLLRWIGHWSVYGFGPLAVIDKASGDLCGEVGFGYFRRGHGPAFDTVPEGMWKISATHRGKGFAREAMEAVCAWFDSAIRAERTVCMIDPTNAISCRLAGRLGFSVFAEAKYKGHPLLLYERLRGGGDLPLTPALSP